MRIKLVGLVALVLLCISAFLPLTVYASADTTAPTLNAWVSGDKLQATASDDSSGIDAILVDGKRINYLVNGAVTVNLKDYAGTDSAITVQAVDFAGNKSETVKITNPYYTPPAATPAPTTAPIVPVSSPATPTPTASPQPESSQPAASERPVQSNPYALDPNADNPLTPEGAGETVDNASSEQGKEFFTINTPDGNTFYLVIDRQRGDHDVYFLNAVTESDLKALAEKDGNTSELEPVPTLEPTPEPSPELEPEPEPEPEEKGGINPLIIILLVAAAGGAGYYFKVLRPKKAQAVENAFDEDMDDEDEEGYEFDDGYYGNAEEYPEDDIE